MIKRKTVVEDVLKVVPKSRDDDHILEEEVRMRFGVQKIIVNGKYYWLLPVSRPNLPSMDDLSRIRRRLQQNGLYTANNVEVLRKRRAHTKKVLSDLGY